MLACRYMVLTNTEIAPLPAPILRSACPLHPSGSPNSRAPPARAPRHIPKPPPTHIPTSPTVPIRVYGVDKHRNSTPPSPSCSQHVPCTPLPRSSCSCSPSHPHAHQTPQPPALLLSSATVVVLVAAIVAAVVRMVKMVVLGVVMGVGWSDVLVSEMSNRQEQGQENGHTGHFHAPFPCPWRLSTPQNTSPRPSTPFGGTESMPRWTA